MSTDNSSNKKKQESREQNKKGSKKQKVGLSSKQGSNLVGGLRISAGSLHISAGDRVISVGSLHISAKSSTRTYQEARGRMHVVPPSSPLSISPLAESDYIILLTYNLIITSPVIFILDFLIAHQSLLCRY